LIFNLYQSTSDTKMQPFAMLNKSAFALFSY
jgi:hypothetical protein